MEIETMKKKLTYNYGIKEFRKKKILKLNFKLTTLIFRD